MPYLRDKDLIIAGCCSSSSTIFKGLPFTSVQNKKGLVPSLEKRQYSIFSSCKQTLKKIQTKNSVSTMMRKYRKLLY
jgi:hypothetical protein